MKLPFGARLYLRCVVGGAIAILALQIGWALRQGGLPAPAAETDVVLVQFVALVVIAQYFPVSVAPQRKFDVSLGALFAIVLVAGAPLATVLVGLGEFIGQATLMLCRNPTTGRRRRTVNGVLFNTGQLILAAALAGAVRNALPPSWAAAATAGVFYLTNSVLVAIMAALQQQKGVVRAWLAGRGWSALQAGGVLAMGFFATRLSAHEAWAPVVMALPAAATYAALKRTETAEEAARLRDEFISVASHELRTPLTSLRGYTQLLLREFDTSGGCRDTGRAHRALSTIDAQSSRMAGLIAQLLDAASLRMGKLTLQRERIDLAALVSDIAATLQPTTRNYRLVVLAEGPIPVDADRLRLEQVLTNLVDNAVKYAGYGDRIEIEAAALPDRTARVAVRDYGVGIPPELRDKVFDRYQQGRQGGLVGGLGIGLYVARQIVELHGGAIAIECPPDGGTRFSIALPSEPGESTAAPPPGLAPVRPFSRPTLAGPDAEAAHTSRPARRMNGAA